MHCSVVGVSPSQRTFALATDRANPATMLAATLPVAVMGAAALQRSVNQRTVKRRSRSYLNVPRNDSVGRWIGTLSRPADGTFTLQPERPPHPAPIPPASA